MRAPLRIFIVENHPDTLAVLSMFFESLGHIVLSATSVSEAVTKLQGEKPDLLLSDIGLSDGSGWDLLKTVNLHHSTYAVAMSGYGMESDKRQSREAGFRYHLVKPIKAEELEHILSVVSAELTES